MGDEALAEEASRPLDGAVDVLVDEDEGPRRQLILQRTDRAHRDEVGDPEPLHGVDIGAVVDVARREAMAAPVARQEGDAGVADAAGADRVRRLAPRALDALLGEILDAGEVVDPRAADDAEKGLGHRTTL